MNNLAAFLWFIFCVFTLICLLFCIEAHFRYRNKRGIDSEKEFSGKYEYFVQAVYDHHQKVNGYELLLREFDSQTKKWRLPQNVDYYPLSKMIYAIQEITPKLTDRVQFIALNMTVNQLIDFRAEYFFNWLLGVVERQRLIIEIDTTNLRHATFWQRREVIHLLNTLQFPRIEVTIENVDSTRKTYQMLEPFLPVIDYLKFNANAFNKSANHWIDITLAQWQRRLDKFNVTPVIGKIEDEQQADLADQLKINLRQGYAFDRPKSLNKHRDD